MTGTRALPVGRAEATRAVRAVALGLGLGLLLIVMWRGARTDAI